MVCVDCGDSATKTIDFDIFGFLEQLPVCCECFGAVHLKVEDNLLISGANIAWLRAGGLPSYGAYVAV